MSIARQRDIGSFIKGANALAPNVVTAGGGGDGVEQNGYYIDRTDRLSGKLIVNYTAVLAQDETLTLAANLQDATDGAGTGVADYGDAFAAAVVATGGAGGSTEVGVIEIDVDLSGANLFVRGQVTPTLSAAVTDTCALSAVLVLSGGSEYPL